MHTQPIARSAGVVPRLARAARSVGRRWPAVVAVAALWLALAGVLHASLGQNEGHLVYAIDDVYIHMAMAKHLAEHGVWGVTAHEFSSSSSSPLWVLLLAGVYALAGPSEVAPLILNVALATAVLLTASALLGSRGLPRPMLALALLAVAFLTPLPALVFVGMEHVLQTLLALEFGWLASRLLARDDFRLRSAGAVGLLALAPVATATRYEGLFGVAVVAALFGLRGRWRYAVLLSALALAPVAAYGAVSLAHGWYWLPNSLLLKGNVPEAGAVEFVSQSAVRLAIVARAAPHLPLLVLGAVALHLSGPRRFWSPGQLLLVVFAGSALLHLQFASVGWLYRYEAYLMALGVVALAGPLAERLRGGRRLPLTLLLALALLSPAVSRGVDALARLPRATTNIYERQYQMGLFLREHYQGAAVAVNDVGAVNYLADVRCLDLWGLGTLATARAKLAGRYDAGEIDRLAREAGVRIAIAYDGWFRNGELGRSGPPPGWVAVGEWSIADDVVGGGSTVTFYAVDGAEEARLIASLREFAPRLPRTVRQTGAYAE